MPVECACLGERKGALGKCTEYATSTGTGGLDSGLATVHEVSKFHVDVGTDRCPALNTDLNDTVEKMCDSDFEIMSATTALKMPMMSEMTMNVCEVCIRTSDVSKV